MKLTEEELNAKIEKKAEDLLCKTLGVKSIEEVADWAEVKHRADVAAERDRQAMLQGDGEGKYGYLPKSYYEKAKTVVHNDPYEGLGLKWGRAIRIKAIAELERRSPEEVAKEWGDDWLAEDIVKERARRKELREKGMLANVAASGGWLVPPGYHAEAIELLRAMAVVRSMGPVVLPMPLGQLKIPKFLTGVSANYHGETNLISTSSPTVGMIELSRKSLGAAVVVSNDLLRESDPAVDQFIRDDAIRALANREDLAFIRGDGTVNQPLGLLNRIVAANKFNQSGVTTAAILTDMKKLRRLVKEANIPGVRPVSLGAPRVWLHLEFERDSAGWLFKDDIGRGDFMRSRVYESNQIPTNLGGGSNESEFYYGDAAQMVIGDTRQMEMRVLPGAAYEEGGNTYSAAQRDQTLITLVHSSDCALRHDEAFAVIQAQTLGA